jgi:hypothetical protein
MKTTTTLFGSATGDSLANLSRIDTTVLAVSKIIRNIFENMSYCSVVTHTGYQNTYKCTIQCM